MLALRIDLLTGRYVATAYSDRREAEWPPHPARVFSALVATHHGSDRPDPVEREALLWLEQQGAPSVCASRGAARTVVPVFVPVNDPAVTADLSPDLSRLAAAEEALLAARRAADGLGGGELAAARKAVTKGERLAQKERRRFDKAIADATSVGVISKAAVDMAVSVMPQTRTRQPRWFPSVTPETPIVWLVWPDAEPPSLLREQLGRLAVRVTRIGHSSSLVACRLLDEAPEPTWVPADGHADIVLRVAGPGQLRRLEEEFARHQETHPHSLPARLQPYRDATKSQPPAAARGVLGEDWLVFRVVFRNGEGRPASAPFPARRTVDVTTALRDALLKHAEPPIDEVLSGHRPDGSPSEIPHVAFLALPFVTGPHPTGVILGLALVFPRDVQPASRRHVLRAVGRWEAASDSVVDPGDGPRCVRLWMGRGGELTLQRVAGPPSLSTLDPREWCRPSRRWATVTPIALPRNPGDLDARRPERAAEAEAEAARVVAIACQHVGLPAPAAVGFSPFARGTDPARAFGPYPRVSGRLRRVLVHAELTFDSRVEGPLLLGSGRYAGVGLLRPMRDDL